MRYKSHELGQVQKKILKHFFVCKKQGPESVSHISKDTGILQPSVHRSVDLLIKSDHLRKQKEYTVHRSVGLIKSDHLRKQKEYTGGEKAVTLTNKGAAAAVMLGVNFSQLKNYIDLHSPEEKPGLDFILKLLTPPEKRDFLIKKLMEYALQNDFFEKGDAKELTKEEAWKLQLYIAKEMAQSVQYNPNIREYLDKYGINKSILKEYLDKRKNFIDLMIRQLDDDKVSQ